NGPGGPQPPAAPRPPIDRRPRYALMAAAIGMVLTGASGAYVLVVARDGLAAMSMADALVGMVAIAVLVIGSICLLGGLGYYVMAPGFQGREAAWRGIGSHRFVLACTLLIVLVANVGPLVILPFVQARGLCSVPSFVAAALSVDIALVG